MADVPLAKMLLQMDVESKKPWNSVYERMSMVDLEVLLPCSVRENQCLLHHYLVLLT